MNKITKAAAAAALLILMVAQPQLTAQGAAAGLQVFIKAVIPALLPFFICAELLAAFGVTKCLAIWLEPVMRPLFRLPGAAAFPLIIGFTSGAPTAAAITANLRNSGACSKNEGERLLAFTNNASPLYIMAGVAGGILQAPQYALLLLAAVYSGNLLFGLLLGRCCAEKRQKTRYTTRNLWQRGLSAMYQEGDVSLGQILNGCIRRSVSNLAAIGGFVIFFSVLSTLLLHTPLPKAVFALLQPFCDLCGIDRGFCTAFAKGLLEMTVGAAELENIAAPLYQKFIAAAVIIAFAGISIHCQIAAMIYHSDLKMRFYFVCRLLHIIYVVLFLRLSSPYIAVFAPQTVQQMQSSHTLLPLLLCLLMLAGVSLLSLIYTKIKSLVTHQEFFQF